VDSVLLASRAVGRPGRPHFLALDLDVRADDRAPHGPDPSCRPVVNLASSALTLEPRDHPPLTLPAEDFARGIPDRASAQ
jgi:hypothetical protein